MQHPFLMEFSVFVVRVGSRHKLTCDVCKKLPQSYRIAMKRAVRAGTNMYDFVFCCEECLEKRLREWLKDWDKKESDFVVRYFLDMVAKSKGKAMMEALRE